MNIIERGRAFVQQLRDRLQPSEWAQRRCPHCGETGCQKYGTYQRHPYTLEGRRTVVVQRYRCGGCRRTYTPESATLIRRGWYAREVRRGAVDVYLYGGTSLRRAADLVRSWVGRQDRWQLWAPLTTPPPEAARCFLHASTLDRWLVAAGRQAQAARGQQLAGVPTRGHLLTDGLWTRLRARQQQVVLLLTDSVSGVIWPPVVSAAETTTASWAALFARAAQAGLPLREIFTVTSDGATGLATYLSETLTWVTHQRCVFHLWRNLAEDFAAAATAATREFSGQAARRLKRRVRRELADRVRAVLDAADEDVAWAALRVLREHPFGAACADTLRPHLPAALVYRRPDHTAALRVAPEWCWRDFRLRLGRGRNHRSDQRLEQAALVWAIYHNFTPAQERSERTRHYRRPGQCPLAAAGSPPGDISYLDALAV